MKSNIDHFGILAPVYERFIPPKIPEQLMALANLPVDGVILDAGGGTGRVAQFFRDKATQVLVADQSFEMLKEAQKKYGLHTICSNTENLPLKDNSLDCIIMVDALHHVMNQANTAAELWRILKPGGRMIIEEPDVRTFVVKLIALAEKLALMRSHFLSPPEIADLFHSPNARVQIEADGPTAWIIVDKQGHFMV
jgi:ubiquinone/menaquinone biosynthesis C-methylase UbiE